MTYIKARKHTTDQRIAEDNDTSEYGLPNDMDKYELVKTLRRIAPYIGLTDGAIAQYVVYLDFSRDIDWKSGNLCMCWLSVSEMATILVRTERQVRNNAQKLVKAGIIAFNLSGNYRRGGFRNKDGTIKWASGVDLKPVLERWQEFTEIESQLCTERKERNLLKKNISCLRRKIINFIPQEFETEAYNLLSVRVKNSMTLTDMQHIFDKLTHLDAQIVKFYQKQAANDVDNKDETRSNDNEYFRHALQIFPPLIQEYNTTEHIIVKPTANDEARGDTPHANCLSPHQRQDEKTLCRNKNKGSGITVTLGAALNLISVNPNGSMALAMCGLPENISSLVTAAQRSCQLLGISDHAWREACATMGIQTAALAVASIDAKGARIKNPGGYLRGMIEKQRLGKLKLSKTIQGLISKSKI